MNTNKSVAKNVAKNVVKPVVANPVVKKLMKLAKDFTDSKSFFELCSGTDYSEMFDIFAHFPKTAKSIKRKGKKTFVLIRSIESNSGKMEALLCRPEGASKAEMEVFRGAVLTLIHKIRKAGFNIVKENGRYFYRPLINC